MSRAPKDKKPKGWRQITIDGVAHRFRVAQTGTVVICRGNVKHVTMAWKLKEQSSPDEFERGQWKRTRDGAVTPAEITKYIREHF